MRRHTVALAIVTYAVGARALAVHHLGHATGRCGQPRMQLVHTPRQDDDDRRDDGADEKILRVSRIADEKGQPLEETGRSVASMQFMVTKAMEAQLDALGYSKAEVDAMAPARAAAIIAKGTPSSKQPQSKPKSKPKTK